MSKSTGTSEVSEAGLVEEDEFVPEDAVHPVEAVQINLHLPDVDVAEWVAKEKLGITNREERTPEADAVVEEQRAERMKARCLEPLENGRMRDGTQPVSNAQEVDITSFIRLLLCGGFKASYGVLITGIHYDKKTKKPAGKKYIVRVCLERGDEVEEVPGLADRLVDHINGRGARYLHVHTNDTVDCLDICGGFLTEPANELQFVNDEYVVQRVRFTR